MLLRLILIELLHVVLMQIRLLHGRVHQRGGVDTGRGRGGGRRGGYLLSRGRPEHVVVIVVVPAAAVGAAHGRRGLQAMVLRRRRHRAGQGGGGGHGRCRDGRRADAGNRGASAGHEGIHAHLPHLSVVLRHGVAPRRSHARVHGREARVERLEEVVHAGSPLFGFGL